jgi:antitoxin (DNA-binding transcriptional repressor) of toxin-antitoxin stability system
MSVTIEEAQKTLPDLIAKLKPGDELIITRNQQPVAQMKAIDEAAQPRFGSCQGKLVIVAEDDEHLEDFKVLPAFLWVSWGLERLAEGGRADAGRGIVPADFGCGGTLEGVGSGVEH